MEYSLGSIYPVDYFMLRNSIRRREASDRLMEIAVTHNPHKDFQLALVNEANGGKTSAGGEFPDLQGIENLKKTVNSARIGRPVSIA